MIFVGLMKKINGLNQHFRARKYKRKIMLVAGFDIATLYGETLYLRHFTYTADFLFIEGVR